MTGSGSNDDSDLNSQGSGGHSGSDSDVSLYSCRSAVSEDSSPSPNNVMTFFAHVNETKEVLDAMPNFKLTHRWEVTESQGTDPPRVLGQLSLAADALKVRCSLHRRQNCQLWLKHGGSGLGRAESLAVRWLIAGAACEAGHERHRLLARRAAHEFQEPKD